MFRLPKLFYSPDDTPGIGELTAQGILDALNADDDSVEEIPLKEPKDEKEKDDKEGEEEEEIPEGEESEELDELDELEKELEPPTEEQLELVTPVRRKEILAKYPKLFKDFPYLEKAYYRDQQFTERFPTFAEADEAINDSKTLASFETDLKEGNIEKMLLAAKSVPNAFEKIADNYMSVIAKVDDKAYHHILGNTIKHTIVSMVQEARRSNNEALQNAAAILNQYVFGSTDFTPPQRLASDSKPDPKADEISEREKAFEQRQKDTANNDITTKIENAYKVTIEGNIDPKKSMSDYVRRNAVRDAHETLKNLMDKDGRLKSVVDKLWDAAKKDNYSKVSTDRIRSAYLSKAKTLLPAVIQKARKDALKGSTTTKKIVEDVDEAPKRGQRREKESDEKPRSKSNGGIPKGMTTLEFLNQD